jgi:hypothetical protein
MMHRSFFLAAMALFGGSISLNIFLFGNWVHRNMPVVIKPHPLQLPRSILMDSHDELMWDSTTIDIDREYLYFRIFCRGWDSVEVLRMTIDEQHTRHLDSTDQPFFLR